MAGENGAAHADRPAPGKVAVAIAVTVTSAAVIGVLVLLTGQHKYPTATLAAAEFFAAAAAAAWLGIFVDHPGSASLAGAIAAGWTCAVLYAATRSVTVLNVVALGIELGCVAAAARCLAIAGRARAEAAPYDVGVILLAAALIPFYLIWSLFQVGLALARAGLAALGRRPPRQRPRRS